MLLEIVEMCIRDRIYGTSSWQRCRHREIWPDSRPALSVRPEALFRVAPGGHFQGVWRDGNTGNPPKKDLIFEGL